MRNYVIINGVNSTTIQGLAINTLPPITKPMIRTQIEEIDGRDGDLVTELGYGAYDKQMEIGLWGTYDIDAIIKYFTGDGTITFSSEPDKYYYFKILNQIDYEKLLKFKTATITMHCQPFKYPVEETPITGTPTTIEEEGESITIDNTLEAPMKIVYKGNTYQNGEPTPDTPIPIQVVSGDNSIEVCGKNVLDNTNYSVGSIDNNTGVDTASVVNYRFNKYNEISGSKLYLTKHLVIVFYDSNKGYISYDGSGELEIDIPNNAKYFRARTFQADFSTFVASDYKVFTEYASYPINLPEGMELCKIGTYQDKIDKSSGKNLFDKDTITSGKYIDTTGVEVANIGFSSSDYIDISNYSNITLSGNTYIQATFGAKGAFYDSSKTFISYVNIAIGNNAYVVPNNAKYFRTSLRTSSTESDLNTLMLNEGNTALPYEPYGTSWYLKKEIGKYIYTGNDNESWGYMNVYDNNYLYQAPGVSIDIPNYSTTYVCTHALPNTASSSTSNIGSYVFDKKFRLRVPSTIATDVATLKTWLSTHNVELQYALATPTYTLIEGELLNQLEAIKMSYEGQTNISQENNDIPFWINVSLTFTAPITINNIGNIYAKPILELEGSGTITINLNSVDILTIDMTNNNKIAIDVPNLEAYNPEDNTLLNRLVTGDYMNFLINSGSNTLKIDGNITSYKLTDYIRWI